jgi:hypothetical protein
MVRMMTGLSNLVVSYTPAVKLLLMIVLMIIGAGCIIPFEKTQTWAKNAIPYVALGAGIVYCATTFAEEIASTFVFESAAYLIF